MAPEAGFEPATWGLTVPRSTAELLRIKIEGQPTVFLQRAFWNESRFCCRRTGATTFPLKIKVDNRLIIGEV
jgi:hypothetical protein